jgi:hypothetical protein
MNIHAIADKTTFDIKAALASPGIKAISRLMALIGIEKPSAPIKMNDLESKMAAAGLEPTKRIEVKIALSRAGLMAE